MEEEDEIESHPSSPVINQNGRPQPLSSSPPPVTVAAPPPTNPNPSPHHHQTLTLALPIQQPRMNSGGGGGGGGREDCWSEGATSTLIDAWGERYLELSRGNLKQKHWKDVADIVSSREDYTKPSKTDVQCKNRIDTLKKKYKIEKTKIVSGSGPSKWNFFNRLEHLIGPNSKIPAMPTTPTQGGKVPVAIPVGLRSFHQEQNHQQPRRPQRSSKPSRYRMDSDSSKSEPADSPDSTDSFPPETTNFNRKRPRFQRAPNSEPVRRAAGSGSFRQSTTGKGNNNWGNSVMELTRAIMKFGEAYEQVETSKLQQVVEMEQQRMEFTKELELQRMQFFMNTQLELSQIKPSRRAGNNSRRHNNNNNANNNNNNNSDNSG